MVLGGQSMPELLPQDLEALVLRTTSATRISSIELVQRLWSDYGRIVRCALEGGERPSIIVKHVRWPSGQQHPRGWNSSIGHERKVRSYEVESAWYRSFAATCDSMCRVPSPLAVEARANETFIVLEDLDAAGFAGRSNRATDDEIHACLRWLAEFHARFLGVRPDGLWPTGTYWHLETRPEELDVIRHTELGRAASAIDTMLQGAAFQTLVHGDAKLANFCFRAEGDQTAAVDFQYVGGGCGMKDVAYFFSSCLSEEDCERRAEALLDFYFGSLSQALERRDHPVDQTALESEWRALYPVAWTDFYRFLQGWSPGHWKIHGYSERMARSVLALL